MPHSTAADRRRFLECFAGTRTFLHPVPGVLWAQLQQSRTSRITKVMLNDAAAGAGLTFTERELDAMLEAENLNVGRLDEIRKGVDRERGLPCRYISIPPSRGSGSIARSGPFARARRRESRARKTSRMSHSGRSWSSRL
jgi:hypothetical protein